MHAVIRSYSGEAGGRLADRLIEQKDELENTMRAVPGFVSYAVVRTADGAATVTICNDQAGIDESTRVARDWVASNASDLGTAPPQVVRGPVVVHLD